MAGLMPKVFEEANLSGELRLSGRKLKDFPKAAAKYNLSDTVIAGNTHTYTLLFIALVICSNLNSCDVYFGLYISFKASFAAAAVHFRKEKKLIQIRRRKKQEINR